MPPSALEQLTRLNINYPMLFKLTNKQTNRVTHCGVLEFVADEGKVYLPFWVLFVPVLKLRIANIMFVDDAKYGVTRGRFGANGECFSRSGYIFEISAVITRILGYYKSESRFRELLTFVCVFNNRRRNWCVLQSEIV